uniref:Tudor domain-containing protein n=1 Tax=Caenorhabditis japonica TaxID=281687 RepID=A0A8R1EDL6_CAEJA
MADNEWYDSYISTYSGRYYFFMIIETGAAAVYSGRPHLFELGSFFKVRISQIPYAAVSSSKKTHSQVVQLKPMEPLGSVRIEKYDFDKAHVHITTIADVVSYVETKTGRVAKLFNDKFGMFIDLDNLVKSGEKRVEFEFRCKASPLKNNVSVFMPSKIIGYLKLNVKCVIGFVYSPFEDGGYKIWSHDLKEDAWLPDKFCPGTKDLYGFWIEMAVDDHFDVIEKITIQQKDIFVSRLVADYPEVLAEIEYDGCDSVTRCHVYSHQEFGLIVDTYHLIENPNQGDLYEAWIACVSTEIPGCRWALSRNQKTPLLLESETSFSASKDENPRDDQSRSQFSPPHRADASGSSADFRQKSSSRFASRGRSTASDEAHFENDRRHEPLINQSSRRIETDGNRSDEPRRHSMTRNDFPVRNHRIRDDSPVSRGVTIDADDQFSRDGFSESETEDLVPTLGRDVETKLVDELVNSALTSTKGELPHVERLLNNFHFGSEESATISRGLKNSDGILGCDVTVENKKMTNRLIKCFLKFSMHPEVNRAMRLDDVEKFEELLKDIEDFKKITS